VLVSLPVLKFFLLVFAASRDDLYGLNTWGQKRKITAFFPLQFDFFFLQWKVD